MFAVRLAGGMAASGVERETSCETCNSAEKNTTYSNSHDDNFFAVHRHRSEVPVNSGFLDRILDALWNQKRGTRTWEQLKWGR